VDLSNTLDSFTCNYNEERHYQHSTCTINSIVAAKIPVQCEEAGLCR